MGVPYLGVLFRQDPSDYLGGVLSLELQDPQFWSTPNQSKLEAVTLQLGNELKEPDSVETFKVLCLFLIGGMIKHGFIWIQRKSTYL